MANDIKYEVVEDFGIFGYKGHGAKELRLRLISWNGGEPRYDLRPWSIGADGRESPNKGFTVDQKEDLETLRDLIDMILESGENQDEKRDSDN